METILVERPAASSAILCHCDTFVFVIEISPFVCSTAIPGARGQTVGRPPAPGMAVLHTKGEISMTNTKVSQWQRIALLAAGLSTSMVSMAWGKAPGLYQQHADGSIWQSTGEACQGSSCPGWVELDNNPLTSVIAAAAGRLYQLHTDGTIWSYVGPPCSGSSCPGWQELDDNP